MTPSDTDTVDLLRRLPLFRHVRPEGLERIADRIVVRKVPARREIFRRGEPCEGLFVVVRGRVRVYRANAEGREQIIHDQGPGQTLAEVPLFDDGPCPANARAEEASVLLFLPKAAFRELYRSEPEIADAVIHELGRRLRRAVRLIEKISLRDVPARVGLTLLEFAGNRTGESMDAPGAAKLDHAFTLPVTQSELAESLATTRESVARALRTLKDEGMIEQQGSRVRIVDPLALEDRCYRTKYAESAS